MTDGKPPRWWTSPRRVVRHILLLDDTDHSKALGVAVGMFVGMTPTVGLQIVIVLTFALLTHRLFYFNRVAAILTVYISNPLTIVPIYWFDYQVGTLFVDATVDKNAFTNILEYHSFSEWWDSLVALFVQVGTPLIVGSLVVASVCGLLTYPAMRWLLSRFKPKSNPLGADGDQPVEKGQGTGDETADW